MQEKFNNQYSKWMSLLDPLDKNFNHKLGVCIRAASIYFGIKEEWKTLSFEANFYEVSNFGRIKSLSRIVERDNGRPLILSEKLLKCYPHKGGYLKIAITNNSKTTRMLAHRALMLNFVDNPDNLKEVNHKDSIRHNNYIGNLEWCSSSYNSWHGHNVGNKKSPKGKNAYHAIPVVQLCVDGSFVRRWDTAREACIYLGLKSESNVSGCCRGNRNTTGGYRWMYATDYYK